MTREHDVVKKFDRMARFYDAGLFFMGLACGGERRFRERVLEVAGIGNGERVLEIGCGTGSNMPIIAAKTGAAGSVVGIDPSEGMLARARKKAGGRPELSLVKGYSLQVFEDESFDAVIYFLVLHELPYPLRMESLRESARVLKPGGRLLIADFAKPSARWVDVLFKLALHAEEEEASEFVAKGLIKHVQESGDLFLIVREKDFLGGILKAALFEKRG